jgi:hypothetical protein
MEKVVEVLAITSMVAMMVEPSTTTMVTRITTTTTLGRVMSAIMETAMAMITTMVIAL